MEATPRPHWLAQDEVAIPREVHDFPRSPEKFLPKFYSDKDDYP